MRNYGDSDVHVLDNHILPDRVGKEDNKGWRKFIDQEDLVDVSPLEPEPGQCKEQPSLSLYVFLCMFLLRF